MIYMLLFHCMNERRYKMEIKASNAAVDNEMLKEEFSRTLKKVKELYSSGKLILNKNSIERFQTYLLPANILDAVG